MKRNTLSFAAGIITGALLFGGSAAYAAGLTASPSNQRFYLDGQRITLQAYEINGNNYVKLRDIGQAVDFGVAYDAATNSVHISPDSHYAPEANVTPTDARLTNGKPVTEENVLELLRQIEKGWPAGTTWDSNTANTVPSKEADRIIDHYPVNSIYGCGGYAAMVSSLVFGDAGNPGRKLDDLSQIRPGDIIFRINNKTGGVWHVVIALESPNEINAFHITDGNSGGAVHWPNRPDQYDRNNLDSYRGENRTYHLEVWTRYPENVPYTGNSVNAWPATSGK
ncbi:MAG: copper amine oxidase N-terminal domain-containing protein [Oscillospiraceae bacterium]|nr:copper amine oxidase N-terminal domain-containing protein [Oscillospiraceae bacterium]